MIGFLILISIPFLLIWVYWNLSEKIGNMHEELTSKTGHIGRKFESLTIQLNQIQEKLDKLNNTNNHDPNE